MSPKNAYFDYAASTPLDPVVLDAMNEAALCPGNPSSTHAAGRELRRALDAARRQIADFLGGQPRQVTFTSGATEANNLAIVGWWRAFKETLPPGVKPRILTSALEHPSVLRTLAQLQADGAEVVLLSVTKDGLIDLAGLESALDSTVVLVTVPWVNNVFGLRQPVEEVGLLVKAERGNREKTGGLPLAWLCDSVQAARFEKLRPEEVGVDMLTLSAHKLYGPKGIGCLWCRRPGIEPLIFGGGQEDGLRSGTENVPGAVGFGAAVALMSERLTVDRERCEVHRLRLSETIETSGFREVVPTDAAVPGIVFLRHERESGENLALKLDVAGIAVSTGSACSSGHRQAPALLTGLIGASRSAKGGIRVSWGRFTTDEDMNRLLAAL